MKLTYWVAKSEDDRVYNVRERTKKSALIQAEGGEYGPVTKVEITYTDAFDLVVKIGQGLGADC